MYRCYYQHKTTDLVSPVCEIVYGVDRKVKRLVTSLILHKIPIIRVLVAARVRQDNSPEKSEEKQL